MNKFIITFLALLAMTSVAFKLRAREDGPQAGPGGEEDEQTKDDIVHHICTGLAKGVLGHWDNLLEFEADCEKAFGDDDHDRRRIQLRGVDDKDEGFSFEDVCYAGHLCRPTLEKIHASTQ